MRILVVVHAFPPKSYGGAEIYAEHHARRLVQRFGDDVHVLTREQHRDRAEYSVRTEQCDGLTVTWINNTFREIRSYEQSYRNPAIARIAADLIDDVKPDVVHVHHLTCLSTEIPRLLNLRGVPVVFTLHDYWVMCHRGQLLDTNYRLCSGPEPAGCHACVGLTVAPVPSAFLPMLRVVERGLPGAVASRMRSVATSLSSATAGTGQDPVAAERLEHMRGVCADVTHFLAPSRDVRDRFIRFGIAAERIELSPYGIDHTRFSHALPEEPVARKGGLRIGFLGTLMVSKAPDVLLRAFGQLPPGMATLDLLGAPADYHGDTSYRKVLEPLLGLPGVRMHGPQLHQHIPEALRSLDVLVMPSIWPETSGIVIREAFLTGLPVIASNIGAIPEAVEHQRNGLLFEPGDVEGLRNALMRLIAEPGLLDRLKTGASQTYVRSLDDDVAATRRLYASLVASPRQSVGRRRRMTAVVLNYRTPGDTAIAVASLKASDRPPDEVIVVDNDTGPECHDAVARWGEAVTYVQAGTNLGFPGGMNLGIRQALARGAELLLLMNSDVVVPPDCLGRLEAALAPNHVGIVGPLVLSRSAPDVVGSSGIDYNRRTGRMRHRSAGALADLGARWTDGDVDGVSGCLMLLTREVFDRVGLFDERYFFGFEEIDLCLRARSAGIRTRVAGGALAYHEGGQAIGSQSARRLYFAARNHLLVAQSHAGDDGSVTRAVRALFVAALNLGHAVKAPGGSLAARVGAAAHGIYDHFRGRYGAGRHA
jgi:GT2 family glycosyltransferase/glycosyltransferase involved in cell wall biosynthesis